MPNIVWSGLTFVFFLCIALGMVMFFVLGHEDWIAEDGYLTRKTVVLGVPILRLRWRMADIARPVLTPILSDVNEFSGGSFSAWRIPFLSSWRCGASGWAVYVVDKTKRRSERIYVSGSKRCAEEFMSFLLSVQFTVAYESE